MPISQQAAAKELLRRRKARKSLLAFTEYVKPKYVPAAHHRAIAEALDKVERGEIDRLILTVPPRHGKLVADSVPVLTANRGWLTHGELLVGDEVYHPSGRAIRVIGVSAPDLASLEVETSVGGTVKVHPNHEWTVYDRARRKWVTLETRALTGLTIGEIGKRGGRYRYQLPLRGPLDRNEAALSVNPYLLGVWLGDGKSEEGSFCFAESDRCVYDAAVGAGFVQTWETVHATTRVNYAGSKFLSRSLKALGVLNDKHIPRQYLEASVEQRLELLAGLIDTDGHVEPKTSRVRIVTANDRLKDDIEALIRSLGMDPYCFTQAPSISSSGVVGRRPVHYVGFQPTQNIPTRVPRKAIKIIAKRRRIAIAAIREVAPEQGRCIQVDSEDGLYLVGRDLIPTHNSELASRCFPAYCLGLHPEWEVISVSAEATLAEEFGRDNRNLIASAEYQALFETRLSEDSQAKGRWNTGDGGGYYALGVNGSVMGRGAHLLIVDDPFKSMRDAQSVRVRDEVWNAYRTTFYNRLMPGGRIVVIMHRMHDDDFVARLKKAESEGGDKWTVINFPAVTEGQALWPEWYPIEKLDRIKANMPPVEWSALYMQNPTPEDGTFFKREMFKRYKIPPAGMNKYLSSDFGVTEESGDATEIGIHGIAHNGDLYACVDGWGGQKSADAWIDEYLTLVQRHKTLCEFNESGVIRRSIEPFLVKRRRERNIGGRCEWIAPIGDKAARARSLQAMASMGRVWLPENDYGERVLSDLLKFPNGSDDHTVDMLSLMARALDQSHPGVFKKPEAEKPRDRWDDAFNEEDDDNWRTA